MDPRTDDRDETLGEERYGIAPPDYRLPADTRVGRVRLQVADLERSLGFYEDVLGMRTLARSTGRVTLGAHGDDAPLIELHELPGAAPVPERGRLGLYHFAILLADRASLGSFVVHLVGKGLHPGMSDHAVSEAVYLHDPDNLGIEVYVDRPRSTWRREGRQLYMTIAPLDVRDLVQTAAGRRWTGMPAATTIGHVHLHVGDIDEASAFYHEGLGLDKVVWSYPGALFLSAGGYHHHLGTNTWATGAPRTEARDARLLDWELVVPGTDAERAAGSLESSGYEVRRSDRGWLADDPWGTTVRLVSGTTGR